MIEMAICNFYEEFIDKRMICADPLNKTTLSRPSGCWVWSFVYSNHMWQKGPYVVILEPFSIQLLIWLRMRKNKEKFFSCPPEVESLAMPLISLYNYYFSWKTKQKA